MNTCRGEYTHLVMLVMTSDVVAAVVGPSFFSLCTSAQDI